MFYLVWVEIHLGNYVSEGKTSSLSVNIRRTSQSPVLVFPTKRTRRVRVLITSRRHQFRHRNHESLFVSSRLTDNPQSHNKVFKIFLMNSFWLQSLSGVPPKVGTNTQRRHRTHSVFYEIFTLNYPYPFYFEIFSLS